MPKRDSGDLGDLEHVKELLERNIEDGVNNYFEYVIHRFEEATKIVKRYRDSFEKNGDYRAIQNTIDILLKIDLGLSRGIGLSHRLGVLEGQLVLFELDEEKRDEEKRDEEERENE